MQTGQPPLFQRPDIPQYNNHHTPEINRTRTCAS